MVWGTLLESIRRKDIYVLLILSLALMGGTGLIRFFGVGGLEVFLKDISLTVINFFVLVLCVTATARQLPREIEMRTIFPLLAKPMSRLEFLIGKYLGSLLLAILALALFAMEFSIIAKVAGADLGWIFVQALYLRILSLSVVVAMVLCLSLILTHGANVIISLMLIFGASLFSRSINLIYLNLNDTSPITAKLLMWIYYLTPHFDLFDLSDKVVHSHAWNPVGFEIMALLTVYAAAYTTALLIVAHLIFRRKSI